MIEMSVLSLDSWLRSFGLDHFLHDHVHDVICSLPDAIRHDFVTDPAFTICDYEPGPRAVAHIPLAAPRARRPSRSVVLKRTLRHRPNAFVRYVIAHELAHAHLHNRGRSPSEDPEHAADALAAEWGFPKPVMMPGIVRQ
jgi:hypothetical protein